MGFSFEFSALAAVRLLRVLIPWSLLSSSSSSSDNSSPPLGPSAKAIKECLPISTLADLLPSDHYRSETCAVCLMEMEASDEVRELKNCSHVFHRVCLDRWLDHDDQGTCPLCRSPLLYHEAAAPAPPEEPSWAVAQLLYLFGDDLFLSSQSSPL